MYHFREGWFRGRVLMKADDRAVKLKRLVCNFTVFFEYDRELLSLALYSSNYADSAKAGVDSWALISKLQAVEAPQQGLLALMPPQDDDMGNLD